jgi:transcriptional regulator with XRE-family HTH domain
MSKSKPLRCPCGGAFRTATLHNFDLEPLLGVPIVLPSVFRGLRCSRDEKHETLPGELLEAMRFIVALEMARLPNLLGPEPARYLRRFLGLTQEELARRLGVERATVGRWVCAAIELSAASDYMLRGLVLAHLDELTKKRPWARKLRIPKGTVIPEILGGVRTAPPRSSMPSAEVIAEALKNAA